MFCMVMRCDDCDLSQPVKFDCVHETFGNLLAAFKEAGWHIKTDGSDVVRVECPACDKKNTACDDDVPMV